MSDENPCEQCEADKKDALDLLAQKIAELDALKAEVAALGAGVLVEVTVNTALTRLVVLGAATLDAAKTKIRGSLYGPAADSAVKLGDLTGVGGGVWRIDPDSI